MLKGFYNVTSAMLVHQRNLNVVGNNLTNISTAGFKQDRYTSSTFDDVMFTRVGNKRKDYTDIGRISYIRATDEIYTDYTQGTMEPTEISLDFGIQGEGFFAVQGENGIIYTRMGTFSLDEEGYLYLNGQGRVLDTQNQPIKMSPQNADGTYKYPEGTDRIDCDSMGRMTDKDGDPIGQLGVFTFEDYGTLEHDQRGMFTGNGAQLMDNPDIWWRHIERSNTDMTQQMTEMITSERALQSAAQIARMYDTVMNRASTDVGRL